MEPRGSCDRLWRRSEGQAARASEHSGRHLFWSRSHLAAHSSRRALWTESECRVAVTEAARVFPSAVEFRIGRPVGSCCLHVDAPRRCRFSAESRSDARTVALRRLCALSEFVGVCFESAAERIGVSTRALRPQQRLSMGTRLTRLRTETSRAKQAGAAVATGAGARGEHGMHRRGGDEAGRLESLSHRYSRCPHCTHILSAQRILFPHPTTIP